jgi:predicted nucleic acid-binding protein
MKVALTLFAQNGSQGVAARDLLHAAVMQNHQLTHIISTDQHFDKIEGIARLDPQALFVA